jgi:hypothetical protein
LRLIHFEQKANVDLTLLYLVRYKDEVLIPFPSHRKGGEFIGQGFRDGDEIYEKRNIELLRKANLVDYRMKFRPSFYSLIRKARKLPKQLKQLEKQSILLYNNSLSKHPKCKYPIIDDKTLMRKAGCVVFDIPGLTRRDYKILPVLHALRPGSQVWVAFSLESSENYPMLDNASFMKLFDYEMSYRKKADIWTPYLRGQLPLLQKTTIRPKPNFCAAFLSSPYNKSRRLQILFELMRYVRVDSYGKIYQTSRLSEDKGSETKLDIIAHYKFTIAFENCVGVDYVTEKLYQPLVAGSIPVYLGAPNVDEFSPGDNSFLNVSDFRSVKELAEFMKSIDGSAFHEWRNRPIGEKFIQHSQLAAEEPFDRLGDLVFNQ